MNFKSGQKKGKRYFLKEKKSRPLLVSKASFLIYLTAGLNLKSQISNKIVPFFGISYMAQMRTQNNTCFGLQISILFLVSKLKTNYNSAFLV